MASNPVVKLKRGVYTSLDTYPTIDGQLYFATSAENALSASSAALDSSGFNLFVLDIENGNSVERRKLDAYRSFYAQQANLAAAAGKWANARSFKISDGTHTGSITSVDGSASAGYTLSLPATISASFVGNLTGTADKAKILVNSAGQAYNVGSATQPIYFEDGIPKAVTDQMGISAESAGKWTNARVFKISDNDGTNVETVGTSVDGSSATGYILKLPATIKATLTGRATSATKLVQVVNNVASDLAVGSATKPVYFANGVPVAVGDSIDVDISGNAATATTAAALVSGSVGLNGTPVYFSDGRPVAVTQLDATKLTGTIPDACFPAKVLERMYIATDETAMQALADTAVQAGDTVRLSDTALMYYVVEKTANVQADGTIRGTNFDFVPYAAGTAANADTAGSANRLTSARTFSITGGATAAAQNFDGTTNIALNVTDLDVSKVSAGTLAIAHGGTGKTSWTKYGIVYASAANTLGQLGIGQAGQILMSNGNTAAPTWVAPDDSANGLTVLQAGKLTNARTINGTAFDGTQNITTAKWGTAREITIQDNDNSNRATVTGIDGSANFSLKLPATIKASLNGNATTATTATKLEHDLTLSFRNVSDTITDSTIFGNSHTDNVAFTVSADKLFFKYTTSFQGALAAGTWKALSFATGLTTGSYIVQIKTGANASKFHNEYFTGVMSYSAETGTGTDSDEVLLHAAGKNLNGYHIYLRTRRIANGILIVEFQSDVALSNDATDALTFTFRRLI